MTDLRAWCVDHGIPVTVVSPAEERRRTPPTALGEVLPDFARHSVSSVGERFLAPIPGAQVWGDLGLVLLPDGTVAAESLYGPSHLGHDPAYRRRPPRRVPEIGGDVVMLSGEYSNRRNWFHWIHEGVLRLHGVLEHVPDDALILVQSDLASFKAESLALLGIPEERLLRNHRGAVFERLWYPSLPTTVGQHPGATAWLRGRLLAGATVSPGPRDRRLFVSRSDTDHARIVNEEALLPILAARGFEVVRPGTLPVVGQLRTFARASHVVGPTGAGLTNLVAAAPGTRVLELLEPEWARDRAFVLWTWAEALGLPYSYLTARSVPAPGRPGRADLFVDPGTFAAALDRWLGSSDDAG